MNALPQLSEALRETNTSKCRSMRLLADELHTLVCIVRPAHLSFDATQDLISVKNTLKGVVEGIEKKIGEDQ